MDPTTPAAAANTVYGKYGESFTQPLAIIQRTISMSRFRFGHVVVFSPHGDTIYSLAQSQQPLLLLLLFLLLSLFLLHYYRVAGGPWRIHEDDVTTN